MMKKEVKVWHLELKEQTVLSHTHPNNYELKMISNRLPEFNRFLYLSVGASWSWYMRLNWTYSEWVNYLDNDNIQTWVAYDEGLPIGYFELELQQAQSVEICYFGLLPFAIGKGYGKALLEDAISKAWNLGGTRVWLHTCTLDHDSALPNYLARGFTIFKEENLIENLPEEAIQPWFGAER